MIVEELFSQAQAAATALKTPLQELAADWRTYVGFILTGLWRYNAGRAAKAERDRDQLKGLSQKQLLEWSHETLRTMSSAHTWLKRRLDGQETSDLERYRLLEHLSALVDAGRLYFPNHSADLDSPTWANRPAAMRGFRDPILDAVMIAHEELRFFSDSSDAKAAWENVYVARRIFVSDLQAFVDPRSLGLGRHQVTPKRKSRKPREQTWETVQPIVTSFEERYGRGQFWGQPPKPRSQLEVELRPPLLTRLGKALWRKPSVARS